MGCGGRRQRWGPTLRQRQRPLPHPSPHPDAHTLGRRDRAGGGQAGQLGRPGSTLAHLLLPLLQEAGGGSGSGGGGGRALTSVSAPGADRAGAVGVRPAGGPPEWSASR